MTGFVSLIGAGPGDPELLTRKAVARLRRADLVLFDALVDSRAVALARRADHVAVGKRAGRRTTTQAQIHALMIEAARMGQQVVRLKGGDPFVFGRGGEEACALGVAGIPYEVIPGISTATAAAAAAGIPVTHRGVAAGFIVLSGHSARSLTPALTPIAPNALTLVILMGMQCRGRLTRDLLALGWRANLPAAIVTGAWWNTQQIWRGELIELPTAVVDREAAGTIVVGAVAALDFRSPTPTRRPRSHSHPQAVLLGHENQLRLR